MYRKIFALIVTLICISESVTMTAAAQDCSKRISIDSIIGVLYKSENLHGARGPTWLVQNPHYRTNKRKIQIRDIKCNLISSFGLYATDFPYGARYYQKSGGSKHSAKQLKSLARRAGSSAILVEGTKGTWIVVNDPTKRQGTIFTP